MSDNITRLIAKILILRDRFYALTTRPWGRVGIVCFAVLIAVLFVAWPVLAQANPPADGGTAGLNAFLLFIARFVYWMASLVTKLVVLVLGAVIEIMLYNSFSTNPVVSAGWAIVRDVVNMFFVVVLIVIAFGTIFGHQRFQWQQQVPKLMIFALVINFSKTLCGIMIDFAQVVMLTFANALREVAAGNFLQLLGLGDMWNISASSPSMEGGSDYGTNDAGLGDTFDYFAAGFAALVMVVMVLATIIILAAILMYRVVMLWIMIVLAPLAWFTGGLKGFIDTNAYAQWWDKFKCLVMVGPVLTFFLWLTLAVAGAGNIAARSGFNVSDSNNSGLIAAIFEMDKFMSFIIGLAMLYAGFDAAQQVCSSMSGSFIGKRLKGGPTGAVKQAGGALVAGAALKVGAKGARLGGAGVRALARNSTTVEKARKGLENNKFTKVLTKKGRAEQMEWIGNKAGNNALGRSVKQAAYRSQGEINKSRVANIDAAGDNFKGTTSKQDADYLREVAKQGGNVGMGEANVVMNRLIKTMGNKKMTDNLNQDGTLQELWDQFGEQLEDTYSHDDGMMEKITKFKKSNAAMTGSVGTLDSREDVENLSDASLRSSDVRDKLKNTTITVNNQQMSADQALKSGALGDRRQKIYEGGERERLANTSDELLAVTKPQDLAEGADHQTQERAVTMALQEGDVGRASELVAAITSALSNSNLSDEQRFHANSALDNTQTMVSKIQQGEEVPGIDKKQAGQIHGELSQGRFYRDLGNQSAQARAESDGNENPYGEVPAHEKSVADGDMKQEEAVDAVESSLGNASSERLANALDQLARRMEKAEKSMGAAQGTAMPSDDDMAQLNTNLEQLIRRVKEDVQSRHQGRAETLDKFIAKGERDGMPDLRAQREKEQLDITIKQEIEAEIKGNAEITGFAGKLEKELDAIKAMTKAVEDLQKKKAGG